MNRCSWLRKLPVLWRLWDRRTRRDDKLIASRLSIVRDCGRGLCASRLTHCRDLYVTVGFLRPSVTAGLRPRSSGTVFPKPVVHAHAVIGRKDGTAHGGHLLEAHIRPTCEVVLTESPSHLQKHIDPQSGLALIRL